MSSPPSTPTRESQRNSSFDSTNDEKTPPADPSDDYDIDKHNEYLNELKNLSDTDITSLRPTLIPNYLFTYALEKSVQFSDDYCKKTPLVLLRHDISKARDFPLGRCDGSILNDKVTLNKMATLDDETIDDLEDDLVNGYLSAYARQYNIVVGNEYYSKT